MRVLNPNYIWTCNPYTANHSWMLSKTFRMCDSVVDDRKLDAFFCGYICSSPPTSPTFQANEVNGNESQDIPGTWDVDLKRVLDDCNPAAKALAEASLQAEYIPHGVDVPPFDGCKLPPPPDNEQDHCSPSTALSVEMLDTDVVAVNACDSPLSASSAVNPLLPRETVKPCVVPTLVSAENCFLNGQGVISNTFPLTRKATFKTAASSPASYQPSPQRTAVQALPTQNYTSLGTTNVSHLIEAKNQPSFRVELHDDKNSHGENMIFTNPLSNGAMNHPQAPTANGEQWTSRTPMTIIQFLTENTGKRKRSSNEVPESTGSNSSSITNSDVITLHNESAPRRKRRRTENKGTKASSIVVDTTQPPLVGRQASSSSTPLTNVPKLPAQRRKRTRKSTKDKPEVIGVDQEPLFPNTSPGNIPQPEGLRQLLPASVPSVSVPEVPSPISNGFTMPPVHPFPAPVVQSPGLGSTSQPFRVSNNLGQVIPGVAYPHLNTPSRASEQLSTYAQYLDQQRALLHQRQFQLEQARVMNQLAGTSFIDPRLTTNGPMPPMLAPTTANNGIWSHPAAYQNALQSQAIDPFNNLGATWTPQATRTHSQDWYP